MGCHVVWSRVRLARVFVALVGVGACNGFTGTASRWPRTLARELSIDSSRQQRIVHSVPSLRCSFNAEGIGSSRVGLRSTDLLNAALMAASLTSFAAIVMYVSPPGEQLQVMHGLEALRNTPHFLHFELQAAKDNGVQAFTCFSVSEFICQFAQIKAKREEDAKTAPAQDVSGSVAPKDSQLFVVSQETETGFFLPLDVMKTLRAGVLGILINACGYGFFISHLDQVYPHEVCFFCLVCCIVFPSTQTHTHVMCMLASFVHNAYDY